MNALARLAALEFAQRKQAVDEAVATRRYHRDQGERLLRLWLAIACAAGAAPRELTPLLADWQEETGHGDALARHILLDQGPSRDQWLAELRRARDTALAKHRANPADASIRDRHLALSTLTICLSDVPEQLRPKAEQSKGPPTLNPVRPEEQPRTQSEQRLEGPACEGQTRKQAA